MGIEEEKLQRLINQLGDLQREITEEKQSKTALRHRLGELKLELNKCKTLLENMPQSISFKNLDGLYVACNRSCANSLQIATGEIKGKTDYDIYPPELAARLKEYDEMVIKSGKRVEVDEKYLENGEEKSIRIIRVPVQDENDGLVGILTISWDTTECRRADLGTQKARELAESIVNTIREPLLVLDEGMRIVMASHSFYSTFGAKSEEIVGKCIFDIGDHQWDIPRLRELLENIIPETHSFENFEVVHDFPTIGRRIMLLNARLIFRIENNSRTILLAFEDITERIEAEKKLKRTREEFLAMLTHDMKGPLSSMLGYLHLIEKPQFGPISKEKLGFVKMLNCSIDTLLLIVHNIVHSSIIEADQMSYAIEDFPLEALIRGLANSFSGMAMISGITLNFDCPEGMWVRADREKIHMVLYNLISNAFRYTPKEGVIGISISQDGNAVNFIVSDTGKGIAESEHEKIFRKYARIKGERRGTGMGLYIVKNILNGHGSDIRFESAPGRGTRFFFSLEKGSPPDMEGSIQHLILLVSDDEIGGYMAMEALVEDGYALKYVKKEANIFEDLSSHPVAPSLILLYQSLNDLKIGEFRDSLQQNAITRDIPVILISVLTLPEWEGKFSAVLPLPLNIQDLKEEVKEALIQSV